MSTLKLGAASSDSPQSNRATSANDSTFHAEVADLRNEILNGVVVFLVLLGWASVFLAIVTPISPLSRQAIPLYGMTLMLGAACAWLSWSRGRGKLARGLCALGVFGLALIHYAIFPSAMAMAWVAVACLVLSVLLGPASGWISVVVAFISVVLFASSENGNSLSLIHILSLIAPVVAATYFTHLVSRTLFRALKWMIESYALARRTEMELRDQQAQLAHALKSLSQTSAALARANEQLESLVKYAEDARRSKQEFAAMISHELRAPLNLIIGYSDLILNASPAYHLSQLPAGLRSDIHVIHRNAQHLLKLVDDILDLSQLDLNHLTLVRDRLRISEVVESALNDFSQLVESRGLWLRVEIEPDLPEIFGDRTRLKQVLLNLLSNALRFTDHGGITIRACLGAESRESNEMDHAASQHPMIILSVSDTGIGISKADLQRVFEPFMQVEGSMKRKQGGTGLGLTISKQFVELHGGRMWVESELGVGSTFYFSLPVTPAAPYLSVRDVPSKASRSEVIALAVVEDTPVLYHLLKRHVQGVSVMHVPDIRALFDTEHRPEIVLLNKLSSPQNVANALRLPVLHCCMAGVSENDDIGRLPPNVCRYLVKPFVREQLYEALSHMVDRYNASSTEDLFGKSHGKSESHILVIEDDEDALRLLLRLLRAAHVILKPDRRIIPIAARSVEQAMDYLLSSDLNRIEGIFLDLSLGGSSGFDLLREMNCHPSLQRIPVCIVSGQEARSGSLMTPYILLEKPGGLSARETIEAVVGLLRVTLPGAQATVR
ncbi:MAG: hybrid sensor histidine kinase/response regulator [Anaerolineae bacterium]|nr:hybrid sensor histidine kinase/response regulator [Candidatus Roseilinea sp.]MDW8449911.1 hybrid sensor histidine kinase/response regulator [Anaerolineae bacterium]